MRRRDALFGMFALVAGPVAAQERRRVFHVGFLTTASGPANRHRVFETALGELGYREGANLFYERRYASGALDRLPDLAADLVRINVDVIVTETTPAALAAKQATQTIPIVMATGGDAVGSGLVASLAHPGGNITGMSFLGTEIIGRKVNLLRELAPRIRRIAWVGNKTIVPEQRGFRELQAVAKAAALESTFVDAPTREYFEDAFESMAGAGIDAAIIAESAANVDARVLIVGLAERYRLPAAYGRREFVDAGGLISYGTNFDALFRHAVVFVDKIFKGVKPADLPVEQPTKFELVLNLRAARAIGLAVPPSILALVDEVQFLSW